MPILTDATKNGNAVPLTGKPRLLDIGCGTGGAGSGYAQHFDVTGLDIISQPRYPYRFLQVDMLTYPLDGYDAYHLSAPCQGWSLASTFHPGTQAKYPNLLPAMRERLQRTGKPYVIENVAGAPLIKALMLCGTMFGLNVVRHRYFESNVFIFQPEHFSHTKRTGKPGAIPQENEYWCVGGHLGQKHEAQRAMGITWMYTQKEIANAIPPAYTRWISPFLLAVIEREGVPA